MRRAPLVSAALPGAALLLAGLLLAGCAADPAAGPAPSSSAPGLAGDLTVYAAASLTESFGTIGDAFTAEHPDVTVTFNFAGSSGLAEGILSGAPVDVFAAASPATMMTVTDVGLVGADPVIFASNTLEIVVPPGNAAGITGIADFANPDLAIALCAPEVPCGAAAAKVFAAAGVTAAPDTLEEDVKAALTKVQLGEVDGAIVYRTDVIAAGDAVEGVEFPESADAVSDFSVAILADAPNPEAAAAFVAFVLGDAGQSILADAGFQVE